MRAGRIIASFVLTWTDNVSPHPMKTLERKFIGTIRAPRAHGVAMEFAIVGLQRCVDSPVCAGVEKTL